ncbi:MAG: rod shape-determining protein MreC [Porticoccus sp.]|nr:rod shape-determining protein MreC [Porticoccus sp.]
MKNLFSNGPSSARRMLLLVFVALCLLLIDTYTRWLQPVRPWLAEFTTPIYWVASLPRRISELGDDAVVGRATLEEENKRQKTELFILKGRLQRMAGLAAENVRLRNLLNATELLQDSVLVSELIGVSPDPSRHTILVNRGEDHRVFVGQAVLDADGLMGQVIEVFRSSSKVLLISDTSHALPVQVLRNGVRSIAEGTGNFKQLTLRYVTPTTDIKVGDQLVSSGLGGRYPVGYPVGKVTSVNMVRGNSYLRVELEPSARIDRSRYLLLVFSTMETFGEGEDAPE